MQNPILEGDQFSLYLDGFVKKWTDSGTSDHYHDYEDEYEEWRGMGVLIQYCNPHSPSFFLFTARSQKNGHVPKLSDLPIQTRAISGEWSSRVSVDEIVPEDRRHLIADFVCKRLLTLLNTTEGPIKQIEFTEISHKELMDAGLIPDYNGQENLVLR